MSKTPPLFAKRNRNKKVSLDIQYKLYIYGVYSTASVIQCERETTVTVNKLRTEAPCRERERERKREREREKVRQGDPLSLPVLRQRLTD